MRTLEKIQILKNVGSSWFALGVNILMGIFLSPFILHRLGDTAFGIWVLIFSVTGYYGIFDFGIRSSIIRFVSKYTATRDFDEVQRHINTAMFTYSGVGGLCMVITLVACLFVDRLFHIEPAFDSTARWLLLLVGGSVALSFPLGVFGGMLEGLQKFYILNWTNIASTLVRVVLIVFLLNRGYGLLTAALITVGLPLLASFVRAAVALRALPISFSSKYVDREAFRRMANYSSTTFLIVVASRLRFKTDALVIGTFLSSSAITFFYAGSRLLDYAGEVVSSLAQIFVPMSSQSDAAGNAGRLQTIFLAGNRACAFVALPLCAVFVILGKSIIEVWVGRKYVAMGYPVLMTLVFPYTLMQIQGASSRVLLGTSRHGTLAIVAVTEGLANLVLSIALVRPYGIIGDALGTAIPMAGTYLLFLPRHACKRLGIRVSSYLREAYLLPVMLCGPVVAVLLLMRHWFVAHSYRQLAVQLLAGAIVYGLGLVWAYLSGRALHVETLALPADRLEPATAIAAPVESFQEDPQQ